MQHAARTRLRARTSAQFSIPAQAEPGRGASINVRTRLLAAACLLIGVLGPSTVWAHVKWFESPLRYPVRLDLVWSDRTLMWLASSIAATAVLYGVHRLVAVHEWRWSRLLRQMAVGAPTMLAIQAAIGLVSNAVHPAVLAPNLVLEPGLLGTAVALIQLAIALSFITGIADWLGGVALICLVAAVGLLFSPADALEQTFWVGIGAVMVVNGRGSEHSILTWAWVRRHDPIWTHRVLVVLRVATGVSLIVVALTEKLWNPDLGRAFLLDRPELNVFQTLPGLSWFSNDVFVLAAGLTEAAIGAMLISGFATPLVILAMWVPFNLGIPVLPSQELLGHLPILGIMYMLLVNGHTNEPKAKPNYAALATQFLTLEAERANELVNVEVRPTR
jgi:hypothetical protein